MSRETLEAEVQRIKDQQKSEPRRRMEPTLVASILPEITTSLTRAMEYWRAFCDEQRAWFDKIKPRACEHHLTVLIAPDFEATCQHSYQHGYFVPQWAGCGQCATEALKTRQRAFWRKRGVPDRVIDATLESFVTDTADKAAVRAKVRDWLARRGAFLMLIGTQGTGKGHLGAGCLKVQGDGLFITHADMLGDLRTSYALRNTSAVVDKWRECEMLVLDEFGLSPGGKDEETLLYQVIAERHDKRRSTILTSNLDLPEVRAALGYRLMDRITEDCVTAICRWKSHRTGK